MRRAHEGISISTNVIFAVLIGDHQENIVFFIHGIKVSRITRMYRITAPPLFARCEERDNPNCAKDSICPPRAPGR